MRATGMAMLAGSRPSATLNAAFTSPSRTSSWVSSCPPLSSRWTPSPVLRWIRPGVIHRPAASTFVASAGTATSAPTAAILPSRMSTVAFSIFGPDTGYTVPPVMATVCAPAAGGSSVARSQTTSRFTAPPPARTSPD